jgi:cytochrome c oxidase subunit 5b
MFYPAADITNIDDLVGPGAPPGTVPTDIEQATGIERLEILGKIEGIDIFDMRPLDASRKGTLDNPIIVRSAGDEQYAGCTGSPADSHVVHWLGVCAMQSSCHFDTSLQLRMVDANSSSLDVPRAPH